MEKSFFDSWFSDSILFPQVSQMWDLLQSCFTKLLCNCSPWARGPVYRPRHWLSPFRYIALLIRRQREVRKLVYFGCTEQPRMFPIICRPQFKRAMQPFICHARVLCKLYYTFTTGTQYLTGDSTKVGSFSINIMKVHLFLKILRP